MTVATVVWGVVLAVGVLWSVRSGEPTAREQTTVAQALPTVDRAAAEVALAALADGHSVVAVSGFDRLEQCRVTVARSGVRYQRLVTAFVPVGTETALLDRVAAALPKRYEASLRRGAAPRLLADAGLFVQLTGSVPAPGRVRFVLDTGRCRPEGDLAAAERAAGGAANGAPGGLDPVGSIRAPVEAILTTLGVTAPQYWTHRIVCPNGAPLSTVEAGGRPGADAGPLDAALKAVSAAPVLSAPDVYAYRDGPVGVAVRSVDGRVIATATTSC